MLADMGYDSGFDIAGYCGMIIGLERYVIRSSGLSRSRTFTALPYLAGRSKW